MLLRNRLPINDLLYRRLPHIYPPCKWCGETETVMHLFFLCPKAIAVWINSPLRLRSSLFDPVDIISYWSTIVSFFDNQRQAKPLI